MLRKVGPLIKKLRLEAGLSQEQLAKAAGTTQAHVAKIESGQYDPKVSTVLKFLDALNKKVILRDEAFEIYERLEQLEEATKEAATQILRKLEEVLSRLPSGSAPRIE